MLSTCDGLRSYYSWTASTRPVLPPYVELGIDVVSRPRLSISIATRCYYKDMHAFVVLRVLEVIAPSIAWCVAVFEIATKASSPVT